MAMEETYTPRYCLQLESAYGSQMMSEGGEEGICHMFNGIDLKGKRGLEIGSGLGTLAFYLAKKYGMQLTCLEVNKWMIEEAERRTPADLRKTVEFVLSENNDHLPFTSGSLDIIYSKGVLAHVEHKSPLFSECYRLLSSAGTFVISDWLSSKKKDWGEHMQKLMDLEKLDIFAEEEAGYVDLLEQSGFRVVKARDDTPHYIKYNQEVIDRLRHMMKLPLLPDWFTLEELRASVQGYEAIVNALKRGELRVLRFIALR